MLCSKRAISGISFPKLMGRMCRDIVDDYLLCQDHRMALDRGVTSVIFLMTTLR